MELGFMKWVNNNLHGSAFVNHLFKWITYLGEVGIAWIILCVVLLCIKKTRNAGIALGVSIVVMVILNNLILKNIINRPRPFVGQDDLISFIKSIGLELPDSSSFPSGHTTVGFACAMTLTMYYKGKGAYAFIPASLIAISRIFLCVHYPSDVLGGIVEGVLIGVGVYYLMRWLQPKLDIIWEKMVAKFKKNNNSQKISIENNETINTSEIGQQVTIEDKDNVDSSNVNK